MADFQIMEFAQIYLLGANTFKAFLKYTQLTLPFLTFVTLEKKTFLYLNED